MQEADRDTLCGPKGRHQPERTAWRGGSVESHATLARGLPTDRAMLFLSDGTAALRRAVSDYLRLARRRTTLPAPVFRCRNKNHKYRNVLGHLPERMHASVGRAPRTAWDLHSAASAKRALERLARFLEDEYSGAAASIRDRRRAGCVL